MAIIRYTILSIVSNLLRDIRPPYKKAHDDVTRTRAFFSAGVAFACIIAQFTLIIQLKIK